MRAWKHDLFLIAVLLCCPAAQSDAQLPDSINALRTRVLADPKNGNLWMQLGQANLAIDSLSAAEDAFKKGIDVAHLPGAYHGLAEVYSRRCKSGNVKFYCLRIKPNLENAIKRDSTYAPAYLSLAEWYTDSGYDDRVTAYYERYVTLRPTDPEGRYRLARTYTEQGRYNRVLELVEPILQQAPNALRFLPLAAQTYAAQGKPEQALALFDQYFEQLSPLEQLYYQDLSLVALPQEQAAYRNASTENRAQFWAQFWQRRDLTLFSGGKMRLAEHYRRVWYARTYFSNAVQPWDRRGEIYIRYGEPDYRSRSDRVNAIPDPQSALVKQRNAFELYEVGSSPPMHERVFDIQVGTGPTPTQELAEQEAGVTPPQSRLPDRPELSWEWVESRRDGQQFWRKPADIEFERWIEPVFPIDRWPDGSPRVGWESWVYTKVGGGVEFVFVDQVGNGRWNFPAIPGGVANTGLLSQAAAFDPGVVIQQMAAQTPEYYDFPPGIEPLAFYYDSATFRGKDGRTQVEIYLGIPPDVMTVQQTQNQALIRLERTVALSEQNTGGLYRKRKTLEYAVTPETMPAEGAFISEVVSLSVPPGTYRLAVQLADRASNQWGLYQQEVVAPDYETGLAMSDLELAFVISDNDRGKPFQKGEVWVVPMPSRSYQHGQSVYLYYEVYNLTRDAFGQTNYRVDYRIRHHVQRQATLVGIFAKGLDQLFERRKPQVSVGYERSGRAVFEPIYFELDTKKLKPGLNQIEVRVMDLNAQQEVSRRALFRMDHPN